MTPQFGTIPDWVTAATTIVGFSFGLRLLSKDITARKNAEEDRRMQYARAVAAQTEIISGGQARLTWSNGGTSPVFNALVKIFFVSQTSTKHDRDPFVQPHSLGTLMPGEMKEKRFGPPHDLVPTKTQIEFTDVFTRRWRNDSNGNLEELNSGTKSS